MCDFARSVTASLPLCIKCAEWDGDFLIISGDDWSFSTNSAWRLSQNSKLLFACWDEQAGLDIKNLLNASILNFSWFVEEQLIDPSFLISDNRKLDIFCSSTYEPWVMRLPNNNVYVGEA